jgi:NADPH2:quinone reductase
MECHPCYQWLLKIVAPYLAEWPDVDVDVKQKFQFGGIGALFAYEIDLLVTPDPLYKPGLEFEPVFDYEQVLVVNKGHHLAKEKYVVPEQLSDGQGATFMQSYLTAWFAFHKRAQVREGATMLVLGAGGGVGLAAVDLGVAMGMRVIAAASSPEKRQLGLDRGAFAAIDVLNEDVKLRTRELCGGGVDMVYDPVGGDLAEPCLRALAPFGQYLVVGFVGGIPRLPANHVLLTNRTVVGVDWGAWVGRNIEENQGMLIEVLAEIAAGKLHPVEPVTYPMSKAVQAMRDLQDRKIAGKVALVPVFD